MPAKPPGTPLQPLDEDALDELLTVRDWLRLGVSRFEAAGLVYGHGTSTALDEAAFLILHTLHLPIDQLEPWLEARLTRAERGAVRAILEARIATRKPAPYLTNTAWIQGYRFYVDERVIVPRSFIGELLGGETLGDTLQALIADPGSVRRVLDLCTGSGCLAILAALAFPNAQVDAVDISADACAVAERNIAAFGLDQRIALHNGDLFAPLDGQRYDLIVTNPPYVDAEAMATLSPEYAHEPVLALAAGAEGLDVIRRIVAHAADHLTDDGALLAEIGRCRPAFDAAFPGLEPVWLGTELSQDEVFWLPALSLPGRASHAVVPKGKKQSQRKR